MQANEHAQPDSRSSAAKNTTIDVGGARLAAIVESSHDAILAKDLSGVVTAWNPAAEHLYGYTAEEMIGRSVETIIPSEASGESRFILAEIMAGRTVPPHDTQRLTKAGTRVAVSVSVSPIRDASGTVIGASTIAHEITARLRAEAERARTQSIVRQSADGIVALDSEGRISHWNPAAEDLFGYSELEAIGHQPRELIRSPDTDAQAEIYASVLEAGQTRRYEANLKHRNGADIVAQVSIAPLDSTSTDPIGAVISIHDMTARRIAERRAREAEDRESTLVRELEQTRRLESMGQLAGGIAHDFNNILGVILNLAAFVAAELPPDSPVRADAQEIELAAKRAATLTRQLLTFSHRDIVEPEVFEPGQVVADLQNFLRPALGQGIRLEISAEPDPWTVSMDRGQLEQIVVNLAVNGRDAMPDGGRLIIETRNTTVDEEFAAARVGLAPGRYVTLAISDTGTGMTPEALERAFEPFYTTKDRSEGTGLGLATVYGIATKAGGRVALYSEPGYGTAVHVHLPATTSAPHAREHDSGAPPTGHGERILIVEDADDVRAITERILTAAGYQVDACDSADRACQASHAHDAIDLILTDVVLTGATGIDLASELRANGRQPKVIFMSGYSHKTLADEITGHPDSGFIEKPFTAAQLQRKVRELLDP